MPLKRHFFIRIEVKSVSILVFLKGYIITRTKKEVNLKWQLAKSQVIN
jgi:hypothetical protein